VADAQSLAFSVSFLPNHLPAIAEYTERLGRRATTDDLRKRTAWLQAMLAWDAGQPSKASARLGTSPDQDVSRILAALFWGGDSAEARKAAGRLAGTRVTALDGESFEAATSPVCATALWEVAQGRTTGVPAAARLLRESAAPRDPAWPPTINQVCATVLETTAAQINGQPQARAMVDSLDRLLLSGPSLVGMSWQNLAVAGLLEKEGQYARAAAAARRTRQYYTYIPFLATYYREAGRLAERAGDRDRAIEGYARYLDLRKDAESALQEEVAQVKQALARLTAERP